jgi:hypothetical protein
MFLALLSYNFCTILIFFIISTIEYLRAPYKKTNPIIDQKKIIIKKKLLELHNNYFSIINMFITNIRSVMLIFIML